MPYTHLSESERGGIQELLEQGLSLRAIARQLKRAVSTISLELSRNRVVNKGYSAERA